ncbi:MAG TPA: hypothetical protein VH561_11860 [Micromonosporaceae bacterium]|jgi:hypothetical protein
MTAGMAPESEFLGSGPASMTPESDFAAVASMASVIPGPIGMVAAGVAAAYLVAGDNVDASICAAGIVLFVLAWALRSPLFALGFFVAVVTLMVGTCLAAIGSLAGRHGRDPRRPRIVGVRAQWRNVLRVVAPFPVGDETSPQPERGSRGNPSLEAQSTTYGRLITTLSTWNAATAVATVATVLVLAWIAYQTVTQWTK